MTVMPAGRHIVEFLSSRPEFVGVGKAKAKRLWDRFGTGLYALLAAGDAESLSEVIDRNQAAILVEAWRNQQALADCVVFFDEQGIDTRVARKAVDFWGEDAVRKIRDNPYRLLTACSWAQIDQVAQRIGMRNDDPKRLVAAVEAALYDRLDRKHTWCSHSDLIKLTVERLRCRASEAEAAIDLAVADRAAIPVDDGYQPAGAAYMERFIEDRIALHLARKGPTDLFLDRIAIDDLEAFVGRFGLSNPLTAEQADAVRMAIGNTFSLLVGGAGVGKTTALKAINAAARHFGMVVYQLAIAGRAANRMAEATGQPAQTVASWTRGVADGKIEVGRHTFVIVDEASMLDLPTLYRILFYLPDDAPILLVGDIAQIPPIGFGLTLHQLVRDATVPKTVLTKILRSEESTGIPSTSLAVRGGRVPELPQYGREKRGLMFIPTAEDHIVRALEVVARDLSGDETQIVAAAYRGAAGIDAINAHFHRLNAERTRVECNGFTIGDPCIWTVNDYDRGLWNGSLGRIVDIDDASVSAEFNGTRYDIGPADLERLELAYCISVHKAQGSQFSTVLVPIVRSLNLDRALLYTAVTRAVDRVVLVGSEAALTTAIRDAPRSLSRDVGLRLRALESGTG